VQSLQDEALLSFHALFQNEEDLVLYYFGSKNEIIVIGIGEVVMRATPASH
jgi:hypothetical protein